MDIEELRQKVSSPRESAKLDFKLHLYKINEPKPTEPIEIQKWTDNREKLWGELVKDVIALTNGNVGTAKQTAYLIIGADDKLRADGTPNLQDISGVPKCRDIYDKINSYCYPRLPDLNCQTLLLEGKNIFVVSIPPSPYLHKLSKQLKTPKKEFSPHTALIRRGDGEEIYEADPQEQATLQREKACLLSTDAASSQPIAIDWKQVCYDVLEKQNRQWLTAHPLGAGARRVADMYVPLELVERREKPARVNQPIDPAQWSVRETEKTTPILLSQFFEDVIKQGKSLKSQGKRIAIVGEPGAGKTTLLQKIAWEIDSYPIWINLADLKPDDTLQEYLLEKWLKPSLSVIRQCAPEAVPNLKEPTEALETAFLEAFGQGQICLLLDGVDEMAVNIGQPLSWIAKELQNGWVDKAKIVLTCRVNVWSAEGSRLENQFDVYRNLDFSPEQVEEFIDKWFADQQEHSSRNALKNELGRKGDRINRLVRNPLRLMLVCLTWNGLGDKLPETKAGLYQRLIKGHYQWKEEHQEFVMPEERRDELARQLGELAKAALDSEEARFRLRESYVENFLGRRKQEQSLFWWAVKLGWLIPIGLPSVEEKDADELVYAFFHPTFQEYFAALAINDWDYFLPCDHKDKPSKNLKGETKYRIFEPRWKEAISLWVGMEGKLMSVKRLEFFKTLKEFNDGCHSSNFYGDRAFFLLVEIISESGSVRHIKDVLQFLIEMAVGIFNSDTQEWSSFLYPLDYEAQNLLHIFNHQLVVKSLTDYLMTVENDDGRFEIAMLLRRITSSRCKEIPGVDRLVVSTIFNLINSEDDWIRRHSRMFIDSALFCVNFPQQKICTNFTRLLSGK
ncbi:NACHT domain-containing protein [Stenomitos frigidus]|uniref:NACHT domain-containing protein n=1 Tax=Stenomitos frigidus ULC18 TaxID=2107698 RepID=A0A2T1EK18_9CYAN|nr:NACHT domain-containing protein [Stenomitos frigidus]PSB33099.1 hypothetical protein C7B82_04710 [Stenomitos frigidus ULC18]